MKTVVFYVSSLAKGGAERVLLMIADYLKDTSHIVIITDTRDLVEYDLPAGITRIVLADSMTSKKTNRYQRIYLRLKLLRKQCKKIQPDVMVAFMENTIPRLIVATWGLSIPMVGAVRGNPKALFAGKFRKVIINALFTRLQCLVFQTEQQKEIFTKRVLRKSIIIPNPMNPKFCHEKYVGEQSTKIVSVGALAPRKNQKMLVEAFALLADAYEELRLEIYGEGELREELEVQIADAHLEGRVFLMGEVEDVYHAIRDAKLFIMTSVDEGIPNALMEAMAIGLPVISTDCPCGGPAYLIQHEKNGLLIPMHDANAAAEAMRRILDHPELGALLGDRARQVQETFEAPRIFEMWRACLERD